VSYGKTVAKVSLRLSLHVDWVKQDDADATALMLWFHAIFRYHCGTAQPLLDGAKAR